MRRVVLLIIATLAGIVMSFWGLRQAQAQIDAFTFFIPYPADLIDDQFSLGKGGDPVYINDDIITTISIAVGRADTIIYYDHWEDGLEDNLTSPTQASTEVWGDGDLTNGVAPGIPGDVLASGDAISTQETITLPRNPAEIFYDGGDKLTAARGNIAISVANWTGTAGVLYAGSWELYPTGNWGTEYVTPIGQDLGGVRPGFSVVLVNVQAVRDNTTVEFDLDADGTVEDTVILNQGEQFTQISGTTNSGGSIQASEPIQVHLFATDPTPDFEGRAYTLVPVDQWKDDYVASRSSSGDFWLYNPDAAPLDLTVTTEAGSIPLTIPPDSTAKFPPGALSFATGTRFESDDGRPFYGVAALDPAAARDWGYSLIPVENLTTQKLVGWAPGNNNDPPGPGNGGDGFESRIYVTALTTTTVRVDFDNDGVPDQDVPITPLAEVAITDPDFDLTGAFLYTEDDPPTPLVAVWGQDETANGGQPSIDVGTAIVPLPSLTLQKFLQLIDDADGSGTPTWGDTVRFEIFVANTSRVFLNPVTITDNIPASTTYIPESTTVGGVPVPDGTGGTTFPLEAGFDVTLAPLDAITATFDVTINASVESVANTAGASTTGLDPVFGTVEVPITGASYELDKQLIDPTDGQANRGDVITYGITITSTGTLSITKLPLRDSFDEAQLTFISADPPQTITSSGVITWDDLTTFFGPLNRGEAITVTVTSRVDEVPFGTTVISNTATVDGAEGSDGNVLPIRSDEAEVMVPPPESGYTFDKRLIDPATGQSAAGETVTFGLTLTNTGALSITQLSLVDTYDPNHLLFIDSDPDPDAFEPGITVWSGSLVNDLNPFLPATTLNLTVTYTVVDPLPEGVTNTTNTATVEGVQDSLGNSLPTLTDTAEIMFTGSDDDDPTPVDDDDSGSDDDDDDDDGGSSGDTPPPSTPAPNGAGGDFNPPAGSAAPEATPSFPPVTLLPETGANPYPGTGLLLLLTATVMIGLILWGRQRR